MNRRTWIKTGAAALGGGLVLPTRSAAALPATFDHEAARTAQEHLWRGEALPQSASTPNTASPAAEGGDRPARVVTPNGVSLTGRRADDGAWVYHLLAEEVEHEYAPGLSAFCWGYNGRVHGPTIEAVEGDRVRIYVTNRLGAPTTVHWH